MDKVLNILHIILRYRYILVLALAVTFIGFVGENSYLAHLRHQSTINDLKSEISTFEKQYDDDTEKLYKLSTDVEAVKRVARERYFMKAADEDVFIIKE